MEQDEITVEIERLLDLHHSHVDLIFNPLPADVKDLIGDLTPLYTREAVEQIVLGILDFVINLNPDNKPQQE